MLIKRFIFTVLIFSCLIVGCSSDIQRVDINEEVNKEIYQETGVGDPGEDNVEWELKEPKEVSVKMDERFDYGSEDICIYKEPYLSVVYNKTVLGVTEITVSPAVVYGNVRLTCLYTDDSGVNAVFDNAFNPFNICWVFDRGNKIIKELIISIEPLEYNGSVDFVKVGKTKAEHLKFISGNKVKFKDEGYYSFYDSDERLLDSCYGEEGKEYITQSDVSQYSYLGGEE